MAHLIDKDALVAEIERLYKEHSGRYGCDEAGLCLEVLEDFIDTLEVKEPTDVFIEKACDAYCAICDTKECGDTGECLWVEKFRKRLMK